MKSQSVYATTQDGISDAVLLRSLKNALQDEHPQKVLLLPPDFTRFYSCAGKITTMLYEILSSKAQVDIMPALGTHAPMTQGQWEQMFSPIPFKKMLIHRFRDDVIRLGQIKSDYVKQISEGLVDAAVDVEVNKRLLDGYDCILSIGQVVPHEVVGMANRNKNIFVGCGGASMINASHMLGAFYGMERIMGRDKTPVRMLFDEAERLFLSKLPIHYILTVADAPNGESILHGLFIGRERERFEEAVSLAQSRNMTLLDQPIQKAVVMLPEEEFESTWLGNKAIYRTRMAIADGGELIILAPGVKRFGEDEEIDRLIRKYGYCGRDKLLEFVKTQPDLQNNLSAAAHLIHGSSDGRFRITYCTAALSEDEVRSVGFNWMPFEKAYDLYVPKDRPAALATGMVNGKYYYISNPALGLWALKEKFLEK